MVIEMAEVADLHMVTCDLMEVDQNFRLLCFGISFNFNGKLTTGFWT